MTGPSTWYSCVSMRPVCGSLPVEAMRQLAFDLQELQGVAGLLRAFLLHDGEDLVLQIRSRPGRRATGPSWRSI